MWVSPKLMVRPTGLEPARIIHWNLNPARLPIPPRAHIHFLYFCGKKTFHRGNARGRPRVVRLKISLSRFALGAGLRYSVFCAALLLTVSAAGGGRNVTNSATGAFIILYITKAYADRNYFGSNSLIDNCFITICYYNLSYEVCQLIGEIYKNIVCDLFKKSDENY